MTDGTYATYEITVYSSHLAHRSHVSYLSHRQPTTDRSFFASENADGRIMVVAACVSILTLGRAVIKSPPDPDALPFISPAP